MCSTVSTNAEKKSIYNYDNIIKMTIEFKSDFHSFIESIRFLSENFDDRSLNVDLKYLQKCLESEISSLLVYDETVLVTLSTNICNSLGSLHPDYSTLASRICVNDLHKRTSSTFFGYVNRVYNHHPTVTGKEHRFFSEDFYNCVASNAKQIDSWIVDRRDFDYSYVGLRTLMYSYLIKLDDKIVERPQYLLMRVAIGIHYDTQNSNWLKDAHDTYTLLSEGFFTHATPTLFNTGTVNAQMASCFLLDIDDDSLSGIYKTLSDCAQISKHAGGIGLSIHKIRAENSPIVGTNGKSNGLIPLLRVFNSTVRYVDQGGGKRKGTIAIYLEPWHPDILDVMDAKKNTGAEEQRTRDLFYALWVPDLFMKRVENNGTWSLFCPSECPGLYETTGKEFETLYEQYEIQNKARSTIPAQTLFTKIISAQIETGTPYILYKDTINKTSNQQNLGTIKSSNLCAEICQYTDQNEIAVCNLASICLPKFVQGTEFNYELLRSVTKTIVRNLNKIIDKTYYPVKEARVSNQKHRPMGIGIQGLADVFAMLHISFDSDKAQELNRYIMETIYFSALSESNEISQTLGSYESFKGSPLSYGKFHFDMYSNFSYSTLSKKWDWEELRTKIIKHGVRNSLCVALMPTASTSQIMGNNDAFEPFSSNIYTRRLLSGEFVVINKHLIKDLLELNLWTEHMKNKLIEHNGSVHKLDIPEDLKNIYKTAFEISPKSIIKMAKDRQFFVDQSQSMNLFIDTPSIAQLANIHMYSWKQGLKTGIYYLRTKPAVNAVKVTLPPSVPYSSSAAPHKATSELDVKPPIDVNFICDSEKGICFSCSS